MTDYFVDFTDKWVDTDDDFWYPLDAIPINAKNAIVQGIGKRVRLQPLDIRALAALVQSIAKSGLTIEKVTGVYLSILNAIVQTITDKSSWPYGAVCWGHDTCLEYPANMSTWSGTGLIVGGESDKHIHVAQGQYMDSPTWNLGSGTGQLNLEKYTKKSAKLPGRFRYKTGATMVACEAASWNNILDGGTFISSGFVKLRIGSTSVTSVGSEAFYDAGGFIWQDDGGFNWE